MAAPVLDFRPSLGLHHRAASNGGLSPTLCRSSAGAPSWGYPLVVLATIVTMVLGFGVWVHHMFATGLPVVAASFFSGASFVITIPSAVATFAWIATIWTGRPVFSTAFHYFAGFIVMFVVGGVSGVVTASVPADLQLTRYLFRSGPYPLCADRDQPLRRARRAVFWFPKMSGRMLGERLGRWAFW